MQGCLAVERYPVEELLAGRDRGTRSDLPGVELPERRLTEDVSGATERLDPLALYRPVLAWHEAAAPMRREQPVESLEQLGRLELGAGSVAQEAPPEVGVALECAPRRGSPGA